MFAGKLYSVFTPALAGPYLYMMRSVLVTSLIVLGCLLFCSCTDSEAVRLRYQAEKKYFNLERRLNETQIKPEMNSPETLREIRSDFNGLMRDCYAALNLVDSASHPQEFEDLNDLAFRTVTRLSQFYFAAGRYDTCVVILDEALKRVRLEPTARMSHYYNLGRALQASGRWDSALTVYNSAIEQFNPPLAPNGDVVFRIFNLPLHIYTVALQIDEPGQTSTALLHAEDYYRQLANQYPGTKLANASQASLSELYISSQQWHEAVASLNEVKDTSGKADLQAQIRVGDIYASGIRDFDASLKKYDEIESGLKGRDTLYRPLLMFKRAIVSLEKGNTGEARQLLVRLQSLHPNYYMANPAAQNAKAETFKRENNWERAENEYRYLIENYPNSGEAMASLLDIAAHYENLGVKAQTDSWYRRAEEHFKRVAAQGSGTQLEATALVFMAEMHRQRKDWVNAADVLKEIYGRFPKTDHGRRALITAAKIFRDKLGDERTAQMMIDELKRNMTDMNEESSI